jgi:lipoprotein-anchoring transpeptidase ErfK/SrfK
MARTEPIEMQSEVTDSPTRQIDPKFQKQMVQYTGLEPPGTVIIDTPQRFLFLVQENGKAMRYGIGVGKPGFTWAGEKKITSKKEWPDWVPPPEMLERRPDLPHFMAGGPENPLGARAMYLGNSLYRIHGSNEPWTIGQAVSSGCIRMRNEDVIDLYERVKVGTKVVVI